MKRIFIGIMALFVTVGAFIACEDDVDEVAKWNKEVSNSVQIAGLKSACDKINYNVSNFAKIVEAQSKSLFISTAYPNEDGYLIVFSDGTFAQLLNGKDGTDGKNGLDGKDGVNGVDGKDGYVPAIAIKKDVDGVYYWICDGAFMLDETGSKVPAQGKDGVDGANGTNGLVAQFNVSEAGELQYRYNDTDSWISLGNVKGADGADGTNGVNGTNGADGKTPTFKIVEGNLLVSYDGENWKDLGNVKGADGSNGTDGSNGNNGLNGENGADGITPEFKIEDGKWYVSYDKKATWLELGQATGDKGDKGETGDKGDKGNTGDKGDTGANGITPKLKIVDGYWYISYDGGKTYETDPIGQATGEKGTDGKTPSFKIEGGALFVSYDGTTWKSLGFVKGASGEEGKTPTMKIESGDWYVSYDEGETWTKLGQATGTSGNDGLTPEFKIESGKLYVSYNKGTSWTSLGTVKGADGVATNGEDGVTPKLKITDGYWYVSYDNEKTWTKLGQATGNPGADGKTPSFKIEGGALFVSYDKKTWTSLGTVKGADGTYTNGEDGTTPKFKIESGDWYVSYDEGVTWTNLGQATGISGNDGLSPTFKVSSGYLYVSYNKGTSWTNLGKVKGTDGSSGTNGVSPKLKIEDDYWYVSYDNGTTWTKLSKATGSDGENGKTPELKVDNGNLKVSYDGSTWTDLGNVAGATPTIKVEDGKWKLSTDGGTTWTEIEGSSAIGGEEASSDPSKTGNGTLNGHDYVDLGLPSGLKWAKMNVGAAKETNSGGFFAWGEVSIKSDYSTSTSTTYGKTVSQLMTSGVIDGNGNLTAEYDVATVRWGENWRMPRECEITELLENCTWEWTSLDGVIGYKVSSKAAGNSNWIFFRAAGNYNGKNNTQSDKVFCIWGSDVSSVENKGCYLYGNLYGTIRSDHMSRYLGINVRPVTE